MLMTDSMIAVVWFVTLHMWGLACYDSNGAPVPGIWMVFVCHPAARLATPSLARCRCCHPGLPCVGRDWWLMYMVSISAWSNDTI